MSRRIRVRAIALFLILSPVLASCLATATAPKATPRTAVKSVVGACTPGAQDETIQPYSGGFKMTSPTSGWALAQCAVGVQPTFEGGSTIQCYWPRTESSGILRTNDGGRTWTDVSPPSVPNRTWHHGQFFLDSAHAWVAEASRTANACVSQVTTYRTSDGGRTWQQAGAVSVKTAKPTDEIFNVGLSSDWMGFVDPQHGWLLVASPSFGIGMGAMTTPSTLYTTEDGGLHWKLVTKNPGSAALSALPTCRPDHYVLGAIKFTSATAGWLLARCPAQTLLTTQDGGATWRPVSLPDCTTCSYQPSFFDSTRGIVTDQRSAVMLATADGGASWAQYQVPAGAVKQYSFTDANHGWLVSVEQLPLSYETAVHRTTDGGRSWSLVGRPGFATPTSTKNSYYPINAVQFVDANVGFVALGPLVVPQTSPDPFGPQFHLLVTEDGGRSWRTVLKQVSSSPCIGQYVEIGQGSNVSLLPIKFATATTAWAKGGLRTTDGGGHWRDASPAGLRQGAATPLYPPGYRDFYLDGDHAWQAGTYGSATTCSDHITTFATSDGGRTWQESTPLALDLPSGFRAGTLELGFLSAQSGWLWVPMGPSNRDWSMGGQPATAANLYSTSDGGRTWRLVATVDVSMFKSLVTSTNCQSQQLGQITFSSPTVGWMTLNCATSKILVTQDAGATWTAQSIPVPCECNVGLPTFVDPKHGFVQIYGGGGKTPSPPTLISTSDGGATWQTRPPFTSGGYAMSLTFSDANNLWALASPPGWNKGSGGNFSLYRSKDGGQSWTLVQAGIPLGRAAYPLLFADEKHAMVAQPRNATWSFDTPGFADAHDTVLAVTSDGGHTWKVFKPALGT